MSRWAPALAVLVTALAALSAGAAATRYSLVHGCYTVTGGDAALTLLCRLQVSALAAPPTG